METIHERAAKGFTEATAEHAIEIRHDDGVYRHIVGKKYGSSMYQFEVITYPWYLVVCGDMGEWIFSRLPDMFEFFRRPQGGINPGYWAEKCRAGKTTEFSEDEFKSRVTEYVHDHCDGDEVAYAQIMESVQDEIFDVVECGEIDAHRALEDFTHYFDVGGDTFTFVDTFEMDFQEYRFHYLWALHAIVWSINEYDKQCPPK